MGSSIRIPDGFQIVPQKSSPIPDGFEIVQQEEPSLLERGVDLFTGESRETPETKGLEEVENAPELGGIPELSLSGLKQFWKKGVTPEAFKSAAGTLFTADPAERSKIIKSQYPNSEFRTDSKGNIIVRLDSGDYVLNAPGFSASDAMNLVANMVAFTPAGRSATISGAALKSAATEAAMQATQESAGGDFDAVDIATSGAIGAAGKALENAISTIYKVTRGATPKTAQDLIDFAKERDLPLMTSDVFPPKSFAGRSARQLGEKIPISGTGAPRISQQESRKNIIEDLSSRYGEYDPRQVYDSLANEVSRVKREAGSARSEIVDMVSELQTPATNTIRALDNTIDKLSKTPSGEIKKTADTAVINELENFKSDIELDPSFSNLEQLRSVFREKVTSKVDDVMRGRTGAAVENIYSSMTKDMDDLIRDNVSPDQFSQWKKSNKIYASESGKIRDTNLKNILKKGNLTPEIVDTMLFSKKPSEVKILFNSLDERGKNMMRAGLVGKAFNKSITKGEVSPQKFSSELDRLSGQLGIAFKGQDRAEINGIKKYIEATSRAGEAGVVTPTGQQLFQIGAPAAVVGDVTTTGGAGTAGTILYGLLARMYESKPMMRLISTLSRTKEGTKKFDKTLEEIAALSTSIAQSQN